MATMKFSSADHQDQNPSDQRHERLERNDVDGHDDRSDIVRRPPSVRRDATPTNDNDRVPPHTT